MKIYIDEGGHFTPNANISVLCALAIPHETADQAAAEIAGVSQSWPRKDGELKGGELKGGHLKKAHLQQLVSILFRCHALLQCFAIDMGLEAQDDITSHRAGQCDGLVKYLLPTHPEALIKRIQGLRSTLERMPNQLYVQFVLLSDLVMTTAECAAMYFAQRRPQELGQFEWVIDGKDPQRVSVQEAWWRDTIGPLGESKSRARPFARFDGSGFDYSPFDQAYAIEKELWWPDRPKEHIKGVDIAKLISGSVRFADSRSDILLQAVDILANHMRRCLNGEIADEDIIRQLGRLQIVRRLDGVLQPFEFASFAASPRQRKGLGKLCRQMSETGRSMLLNPPNR